MIDRLTGIEAVLAKLISQVHKVALGKGDFVRETGLLGLVVGTLDLEVVVVETDNVGVREPSNLPSGSTDAATDVENSHTRLELHHVGEVMLVSGKLPISSASTQSSCYSQLGGKLLPYRIGRSGRSRLLRCVRMLHVAGPGVVLTPSVFVQLSSSVVVA